MTNTPQDPPARDAAELAEGGMADVPLQQDGDEEFIEGGEVLDEESAVSSIAGDDSQAGNVPRTPEEKKYTTPMFNSTFAYDDASAMSSIGIKSARQTAPTSHYTGSLKVAASAEPEKNDDEEEEENSVMEESESAISAVADGHWDEDENKKAYGFRGFCACPNGPFGIASILLSLVAFVLTGSATDRCDFVKVGDYQLQTLWELPERDVGLIKYETDPDECTYWFDDTDTAALVYDQTFQAARIMSIATSFLSLVFIGVLCTATCVAYGHLFFRRLAFVSLAFPLIYGVSFVTLGSDMCQQGSCSIGVGGLVMVLGVVIWFITACMLSMVPDPRGGMVSNYSKTEDNPRHRVYLGIAILVTMAIIAAVDLSVISFRSARSQGSVNDAAPTPGSLETEWLQAGETMMGPYPDTPEYISLSGDATTMALIGKETVLAMVYDFVKGVWYPQGNMIPANTDRKGWDLNDRITKIRSSAASLSEEGKVLAVGSSNWADASSTDEQYQFGQVMVWKYDILSNMWRPRGLPIYGKSKGDSFASKLELSSDGSRLAVLASNHEGQRQPYVRIYQYNESSDEFDGEWNRVGDDVVLESAWAPSGFAFSGDGSSLALGSRRIGRLGLVTVWKYDEGSKSWNRRGSNIASGLNAEEDNFGASVDLNEDGSIILIGDPGVVPSYARALRFKDDTWETLGQDLECNMEGSCAHDVAISKHGSVAALTGYNTRQMARVYSIAGLQGDWKQVGEDIFGPQSEVPTEGTTIDLAKDGNSLAFGVMFQDTRTQVWQYTGDSLRDTILTPESETAGEPFDQPLTSETPSVSPATESQPDATGATNASVPALDLNDTTVMNPSIPQNTSQSGRNDTASAYLNSFGSAPQTEDVPEQMPWDWISATEHKKVMYFLFASPPHIERYDIAAREFLPKISLPTDRGSSTAFGVSEKEQLLVAYGRDVYRYDINGTNEEPMPVTADADIIGFQFDGDLIFINAGQYFISVNGRATNNTIKEFFSYNELPFGSAISTRHKRILGRTPDEVAAASGDIIRRSDIWYKDYGENGDFVGEKSDSIDWNVNFASAAKTWMFPDETRIIDDGGHIFSVASSEHVFTLATKDQSVILDIAWLGGNVMVILQQGGKITAISQELVATGSMNLGYDPRTIAVDGGEVLTFKPRSNSTTGIDVNSVYLGMLNPSLPGRGIDPTNVPYNPGFAFVDKEKQLYILSRSHSSIFVMNTTDKTYQETIPLEEIPQFVAYSEENNEIYTFRTNGVLSKIILNSQKRSEVNVATLPSAPLGLSTAGKFIFVCDESGSVATHYTFLNNGTMVSGVDWNHVDEEYVWNEANRKMYFFRQANPTDLMTEHIYKNGTIGIRVDSYLNNNAGFEHPIRVDPTGQYAILGSGVIHNARSLKRLNVTLANDVLDVAFTDNDVRTIRNIDNGITEIQQWSLGDSFALGKVVQVNGKAHRLLAMGEKTTVAITTNTTGYPTVYVIDEEFKIL